MTAEGRLARGKANYEAGKFLDNSETLAYIETLPKEKPKEEVKPKEEKKNAKPTK
ncbi:hypothetical protein LCGC14_2507730 [marine sediment metagenome]|uniref:Uncharacterized protein n=1 Tax=marine sediment metagenome TaxID=412755 RepID=A0A0F9DTP7_9ZZZZ